MKREIFKDTIRGERGIVLVAALLMMVVLAFLGAAIIFTSTMDIKISKNTTKSNQALMVSEAGLSDAINHLRNNPSWGPNSLDTISGGTWADQSQGAISLPGSTGSYTVTVYDAIGSNGRNNNNTVCSGMTVPPLCRPASEQYATLGSQDVLIESSGTVDGVARKIGLILRTSITAFDYATYSDGELEGTGSGANPGTFIGKLYADNNLNLQGNYNVSQAEASAQGNITPNCNSGKFESCNDGASAIEAPVLDFPYYQDQDNFSDQQVYVMTPGLANVPGTCTSPCSWNVNFAMTTLGTSYTATSRIKATKTGSTWNHTVFWCANAGWDGLGESGTGGGCTSGIQNWTFASSKAEKDKPFIGANQWNAYVAPSQEPYIAANKGAIVNVFDSLKHLEFIGPNTGSTTVTSTILVGTASNNTTPVGKIDIEGGAGTLNFQPSNGLSIVAETVEFNAKYSSINVNVGTATNGAVIVATEAFEVEASTGNTATFNMSGSIMVGGDNDADANEFGIGGNGVAANFTYVPVQNLPQGWQNYGTLTITRREWREL